MATIQIDESIGNLQAFIAVVAETSRTLDDRSAELEAAQGALEGLGRDAEKAFDGLSEGVQEALSDVESAHEAAESALEELARVAEDATLARLESLTGQATEVGDEVRDRTDAAQGDEESAFSSLETAGFDALSGAIGEAETSLQRAATGSDAAFAEVRDGLQKEGSAMETAGQELGTSYGEAEAQARQEATELGSEMQEVTRQWASDVDESLESGCTTLAGALEASFDDWDERAAQAADATLEGVQASLERAAQCVADAQGIVDGKAAELLEGPAADLAGELDETDASLEDARSLAAALEMMVPELRITLRVVEQVDQLLANLD